MAGVVQDQAPAGVGARPWRLASDVHAVAVGEDLVFLDVVADAYFCLVGAASSLVLAADGGVSGDADALEALCAAGLIATGEGTRAKTALPSPAVGLGPVTARIDPVAARRTVQAGLAARHGLRRRRFQDLLAWARDRPTGDLRRLGPPTPALRDAARGFLRLRLWVPFDGACLMRSYMMLRYLRLCGHDAAWVIGVRTWPFVAHCWLQAGDTVLDDDPERLVAYSPILVV
ncbi:MAG: lasso peptide biosynthesis B2 protein [Caulobacter sp.]